MLFLDDDVDVRHHPDLLTQYVNYIREEGAAAAGFVGATSFPPPNSVW